MLNSCQIQVKFGNIIVQLLIDTYVVALGCNAVAAEPLNYVIFFVKFTLNLYKIHVRLL